MSENDQDYLVQAMKSGGALTTASGKTIHVYWRGTPEYNKAIVHAFPNGIREAVIGVVEPGNDMELIAIVEQLASRNTPFALKSGGHISIPKIWPSNNNGHIPIAKLPGNGILIALKKYNHIKYDKTKKTLDVGVGLTWGEVYKYLEPFTSNHAPGVVGGDPVTGVAGWLLGGGYSIQTNRFGLGIDNIVRFRVYLPGSRNIIDVSPESHSDLFRALKGGGHNFGVITQFTLRVHELAPRTDPVESRVYTESESHIVKDRLIHYIKNEIRPEVVVLAAFRHDLKDGQLKTTIPWNEWLTSGNSDHKSGKKELAQFFFRRDQNEIHLMTLAEAYEAFSLRHLPVSLETLQTDSEFVHLDTSLDIGGYTLKAGDLVERKLYTAIQEENQIDRDSLTVFTAGYKTVVTERPQDLRGRMASIMVSTYTRPLIDEAEKQAKILSGFMKQRNGLRVSFEIWPFQKVAFNGVKRKDSAWPHEEGKVVGPLVGWFEWTGKHNDDFWLREIAKSLNTLTEVALKEHCTTKDVPAYLNITLEETTVQDIYRDHYNELKTLQKTYDPENVMGLAAGFVLGGRRY